MSLSLLVPVLLVVILSYLYMSIPFFVVFNLSFNFCVNCCFDETVVSSLCSLFEIEWTLSTDVVFLIERWFSC